MHTWLHLSLSEVNTRVQDCWRKPTFTTLFLPDTISDRQTLFLSTVLYLPSASERHNHIYVDTLKELLHFRQFTKGQNFVLLTSRG